MKIGWSAIAMGLLVASAHCSSVPAETGKGSADQTERTKTPPRDWGRHPAILEMDTADQIYAVSDAHGGYEPLVRLLAANKLVDGFNSDPAKMRWTGGTAILVIAGDMIDKGPQSLEVIDLLRSLEKQAPGRIIALMGNHEAEFLADPKNDKATSTGKDAMGIDIELKARGIEPASLVAGRDLEGRGLWLSSLPFGVRIKKWFFAHGGNTDESSIKDLSKRIQNSVDNNGYDDKDITGDHSILEEQKWYGDPDKDKAGEKNADALGVKHIVFGHDPGAMNAQGRLKASKNGILFKIDCAMGLQDNGDRNPGFLLHVSTVGKDTAESLDVHGQAKSLL